MQEISVAGASAPSLYDRMARSRTETPGSGQTLQPESLQPESLQPESLNPESLQPETLSPEGLR